MKKIIFLSVLISSLFFINCRSENPSSASSKKDSASEVVQLTEASFKKLVFNYDVNKEWKYEGDKPAIIDVYADWCAPCRQLSPIVEEIAKEYSGRINVYKIDTEKEKLLAQNLGISGLPTLLFISKDSKPQVSMGLISKEKMVQAINEVLLIN